MAKKKKGIQEKIAKARIQKTNKDKSEEDYEEEVGEPLRLEEDTCNVGVSGGFTYNLGDFNSTKIQVSLNIPCPHDEIDQAFEFAKEWVEERVQDYYDELEEDEEDD